MKRLFCVLLCLLLAFSLFACGKTAQPETPATTDPAAEPATEPSTAPVSAAPTEEAAVFSHIHHDLGSAGLRHKSSYPLADVVASQRALLGVQLPCGRFDSQLVPLQKRERSTEHPHGLLKDVDDVLEKFVHVPLAHHNRGYLAQNRYLR